MLENLLASLFVNVGSSSPSGSTSCPHLWLDEPEMPKSMIEK